MAGPIYTVEAAFVANPYGTLVWTDITGWLDEAPFDLSRGRNPGSGGMEPGKASLFLKNTDGRFDGQNTTSPYYPYVAAGTPIRFRATAAGVTYDRWRGYAERWRQRWTRNGAYGLVEAVLVDGLSVLANYKFPAASGAVIAADSDHLLYNPAGPDLGATGGATTNVSGNPYLVGASSTSITNDSNGSMSVKWNTTAGLTGAPNAYAAVQINSASAGSGFDCRLRLVSAQTTTSLWADLFRNSSTGKGALSIGASATAPSGVGLYYNTYANANTMTPATSTLLKDLTVGATVYIAMVPSNDVSILTGATGDIYIDGAKVLAGIVDVNLPVGLGTVQKIGYHYGITTDFPVGLSVLLGAVAVYGGGTGTKVLTATKQTQHYTATSTVQATPRYTSFESHLTSVRVGQALDSAGWATADRAIDTGQSSMQAVASVAGRTALDIVNEAVAVELGRAFLTASGQLAFHSRRHLTTATPVITFGEADGEVPYSDLVVERDRTLIVNDAQITRTGDTFPQTAADLTSQSRGVVTYSATLPVVAAADAQAIANTIVARKKDTYDRVEQVVVDLRRNPSTAPAVLVREIGDVALVNRRPPGARPISFLAVITGIEDRSDADSVAITFKLDPFPSGSAWIAGDTRRSIAGVSTYATY